MTVRTGLGLSCVALLTVAACAPPPPSPDGGGSDVTIPDASGDGGGSMTDGPVGDAGPQCNRVTIENLEALGTRMGSTLRYAGDNNSASEVPTVGAQSSAAIQGLSGCQFRMAYQRVFAYTATQDAVLRISTSNMGTSTSFDTALLVYNAPCPTTAANQGRAFLGCNDDDLRFDGDDRRTTSNVVTLRKVARGATVYISLGGFVPVSGTRNTPGERGAFDLTVDELPVVANGMACDARRLTNACDDTSTCVGSSFTSLTGTCRADGSVAGAQCAEGGMCMGAGLQCNAETNICEATNIADGMPCNPFAQCGANSTCVGLQRGLTSGTCRANGSIVGAACATGNTCGMGLTCVTPPGATEGICLNAAPMGGMCNTFDSVCPTGQDCLGSTVFGTAGTCTGLGTAAGADCNSGMCTAPLACTMRDTASICTNSRMTGQSCGVFDECAMGGTCYLNEPNNRTAGTCFAAGVRGGPCRTSGTACDAGLTCSDTATPANGRCLATAMMGGMCDLSTDCPDNSMCVRTSATGMPYAGTCRAFGAEGARCRFTGERCDAGLTCSSNFTADGICQRPAMGTCDPRLATNRCAAGQVCRATSLDTGMCAAPTMEMGENDAVSATLPVTTAPAAILGSLTFADVDCFAFEATGQALFAKVNNPSGLCSAELALDLYRLDGTNVRLLGGDTNAGAYGCPRIDGGETNYSFAAGLMGRHYLCVRNAADNRAPVSQYALSIALR